MFFPCDLTHRYSLDVTRSEQSADLKDRNYSPSVDGSQTIFKGGDKDGRKDS